MAQILIVDDDEFYCDMLTTVLRRMGHDSVCATTLEEAILKVSQDAFDVVFLDVHMPDGSGLDFIPQFQEAPSSPEVIILTGAADRDGAEMAIRCGAWDYVQKGASLEGITLPLVRALQYRNEKRSEKKPIRLKRDNLIGNSSRIKACLDLMAQAANSNANVLIIGETGTGKELFARAIHENSARADHEFVIVDCAALPDTLVESVLFGHVKGAFTGADQAQEGLVRQADRGTLFLDEVGELPLAVQKSFLRVLQERIFRPVGGQKEVKSDFRLVAATNRNLEDMAQEGLFRTDLLFRLRGFLLELAPLRESPEDIRELALHYMVKLCQRNYSGTKGFSPEFMEALVAYHWPGNVRELVNTIDRSLAAAHNEPTLYPKHLPPHIRIYVAQSHIAEPLGMAPLPMAPSSSRLEEPIFSEDLPPIQEFRDAMERNYMEHLIKLSTGNVRDACRISGLSKSRFYDLIKKHGLSRA